MENFISNVLQRKFTLVEIDNNCKAGHGHTLSIKIVMPCYCQANCEFCFNKQTINTQKHNWNEFIENLNKSLDNIFKNVHNRKISLDITGNEPTFNINQFAEFMMVLHQYKIKYHDKIDKIVLTTNGFHLYECIPYMENVVDIVNISLHNSDYNTRMNIFKTKYIPSNEDLKDIIKKLNNINITVTSVAVVYFETNIKYFVTNFSKFSEETGFKDARIRINFTTDNKYIRNQFYNKIDDSEEIVDLKGLSVKYLDFNGYKTNIYLGVTDLIDYVIGVELVIDDNGLTYIDYNKRYPVTDKYLNDFDKNIFVLD